MEETGRKCTKCGRGAPDVWFYSRKNGYGKLYTRELCNECYAESRQSHRIAVNNLYGPGDSTRLIRENRPPEGTPCALCGEPMYHVRGGQGMVFDHDPVTHEFRGWIHFLCNTSLGGLGDTAEGIAKALKYVTPK